MLSYKEYKLLNESLYGAFNLGLKNPNVVAGVVSSSNINGTEAAIEAEAEEAIEEGKMKKKMDCGSEDEEMEDEEMKKKVSDEEGDEEDSEDDEDSEEESEEGDDEEESEKEKEEPKFMKKKAKKEWSEIVSDLESFLEDVSEEESLMEIKKGLEIIKEGMKKSNKHKKDCGCPFCEKAEDKKEDKKDKEDNKHKKDKEDNKEEVKKGLTDAQKKLPKALQDAILAKQGKSKDKDEEKKCSKCSKYMTEEEQTWWNSVNGMLNADPDQRNWDGMFKTVDSVETAIRDEERPA